MIMIIGYGGNHEMIVINKGRKSEKIRWAEWTKHSTTTNFL